MKSDMDVRRDVEAELRWEPRVIDATGIGVAVKKASRPSPVTSRATQRNGRPSVPWSV